jgi:hypothetical protein
MLPDAVAGRVGLVCAQLGAAQRSWSWRLNLALQGLRISDRSEKSSLETFESLLSASIAARIYQGFQRARDHPRTLAFVRGDQELRCRNSISGLVVEYIVAIDVTRVRFPADAFHASMSKNLNKSQRNLSLASQGEGTGCSLFPLGILGASGAASLPFEIFRAPSGSPELCFRDAPLRRHCSSAAPQALAQVEATSLASVYAQLRHR